MLAQDKTSNSALILFLFFLWSLAKQIFFKCVYNTVEPRFDRIRLNSLTGVKKRLYLTNMHTCFLSTTPSHWIVYSKCRARHAPTPRPKLSLFWCLFVCTTLNLCECLWSLWLVPMVSDHRVPSPPESAGLLWFDDAAQESVTQSKMHRDV